MAPEGLLFPGNTACVVVDDDDEACILILMRLRADPAAFPVDDDEIVAPGGTDIDVDD